MERVEPTEAARDQELVARCRAGDEGAFDELVLRHQHRALNVAYQVLRNHEDACEVAQDAFVNVYRHINEFRGESEFRIWLHQIVLNLARNKHRWWKRRGRPVTVSMDRPVATADGALAREFESSEDAPDRVLVKTEFVREIGAAMERLPRRFREVLVLRNIEELSYDEIARVLDCSVGTVKSRMARAREALRGRIKTEG